MEENQYDVIVVGAGQGGLGISYFLKENNITHVVFERGRIGESWLSQRWDSFQLNTINEINTLPGVDYDGPEPDGFWRPEDLVNHFNQYVNQFDLPVQTGVSVTAITQNDVSAGFTVEIEKGENGRETFNCKAVVIASGIQNTPKTPPQSNQLPDNITNIHAADYENPSSLPQGAVIVVGSGQTGVQITEDLLGAGRKVYLSTSKVGRVPRRYRGKDISGWMKEMKFLDVTYESLEDPNIAKATQPQVSGVGRYGHTVSLQSLAKDGAIILGRLESVKGDTIILGGQVAENVLFGDQVSQQIKDAVDTFLEQEGIEPPPLEPDPADEPDPQASFVSDIQELNLVEAGVSTVIWATGFGGDFSWLKIPGALDDQQPNHKNGVSPVSGLFYMGFPWLIRRGSGILYGIKQDAKYISEEIKKFLS